MLIHRKPFYGHPPRFSRAAGFGYPTCCCVFRTWSDWDSDTRCHAWERPRDWGAYGRFTRYIPAATSPRPVHNDHVSDSPRNKALKITPNKGVRNVKAASRLTG